MSNALKSLIGTIVIVFIVLYFVFVSIALLGSRNKVKVNVVNNSDIYSDFLNESVHEIEVIVLEIGEIWTGNGDGYIIVEDTSKQKINVNISSNPKTSIILDEEKYIQEIIGKKIIVAYVGYKNQTNVTAISIKVIKK